MQIEEKSYGLKQALCQQYCKFDSLMMYQGYAWLALVYCVYVKKFDSDDYVILLIYVSIVMTTLSY